MTMRRLFNLKKKTLNFVFNIYIFKNSWEALGLRLRSLIYIENAITVHIGKCRQRTENRYRGALWCCS
jgi:hypothetical protein